MLEGGPGYILRVIRLTDHDPDPILVFLEKPSYLKD